MNHTLSNETLGNQTSSNHTIPKEDWVESSAMVYVALTVATFSALTIFCVWFFKNRLSKRPLRYNTLDAEEELELAARSGSDDEIDIPLDAPATKESAFTLNDSSEEDDEPQDDVESVEADIRV